MKFDTITVGLVMFIFGIIAGMLISWIRQQRDMAKLDKAIRPSVEGLDSRYVYEEED
jgi:MFS superfamily sulfate permease-like transporter